jgi:predicted RNA-binding protein YlxR (DUF448 family)
MCAKATADDQDERAEGPLRLCAVSRTQKPPEQLIRFVAAPDGVVTPDLARRLPGRGIWVDATRASVAEAMRRKVFARGMKQPATIPADLPELIERLMVRRLGETISLANKAGLVTTGSTRVEEAIATGKAVLLIHAADAAPGGQAKLDRKFETLVGPERAKEATVCELAGIELDLAIGRSNVVHAAASDGGASQRILQEAARLKRYRSGSEPSEHYAAAHGADTGPA